MSEKKTRNRKTKQPYKCIRCDYTTYRKSSMKRHLYELTKPCPATENDLELNDDIKDYILKNRVYHIPKEEKPKTIYQTINNIQNNNNTMNNYLNSLPVEEKYEKLIKFGDVKPLGIEFMIEGKYEKPIKKMDNDKYRWGMHLNTDNLLEIVDNISKVSENFEDFNVIYDAGMKKIKLYSRSWNVYLVEMGVKKLVETIQDNYLYAYEMYLIKKIYNGKISNYPELTKYKNSLYEYYKFMNIFDVQPYCVEKTNNDILEDNNNSYEIQDKIFNIYNSIAIPKGEINKMKKIVLDIIKSNSKNNINELNKKLIDLLKMNDEFKEDLLINLGLTEETNKKEPRNEIIEET